MTTVVLNTAPAVPLQRTAPRMDVIAPPKDTRTPDIEYVESIDDFFTDTDPSVIEPTPDIVAAREEHKKQVHRRQRGRHKAAQKPRNRMMRDTAEQNARTVDNGGGIKKPKLPRCLQKKLFAGDPLTDIQLRTYKLTNRQYRMHVKNVKRAAKAKQSKKVALAVA